MKELSTKEETLDVVRQMVSDGQVSQEVAEKYFPELKSGEDARIRKALITFFQRFPYEKIDVAGTNAKEAIAWLEKQGENAKFRNSIQVGDKVTRNKDGVLVNLSQLNRVAKKQGEQKPYGQRQECVDCQFNYAGECKGSCAMKRGEQKPADKVEPKFKIGDWCIDNEDGTIFQIVKVLDNTYTYKTNEGKEYSCTHYSLENDARLWTIQDAKDGDVLFMDNGSANCIIIYKSSNNGIINKYASYDKFGLEGEHYLVLNDGYIIPATKEQRELLFQKMKEAGYEWDAEKKKLKNIEQDSCQWPAMWCEDDEYHLDSTVSTLEEYAKTRQNEKPFLGVTLDNISWLKLLKNRVQPQQKWSEEDEQMLNHIICDIESLKEQVYCKTLCDEEVDFLKSLKDRVQPQSKQEWKPSKEQMEALESATENCAYSEYQDCLLELLGQLKKLKE